MRERSLEEIQAIAQGFPDVYLNMFGEELCGQIVAKVLNEEIEKRKMTVVQQRFQDFSVNNLKQILEIFTAKPPIEEIKKAPTTKRGRKPNVENTRG
jgi:hypothetical protein